MASTLGESSDDEEPINLFQEPEGYYAPKNPPSLTEYHCQDGTILSLRLVGYSPLWGHLLWNAGKVIATYLEDNASALVKDKTVLELGAGAGLPSLVSSVLGARKVVVTDYPEAGLIQNLKYNIDHCGSLPDKDAIVAEGYLWGNPVDPLRLHLPQGQIGFDLLILADVVFNHSEHAKLVQTVREALKRDSNARALVFFTPYRPWLLEADLNFFKVAQESGFEVTKLMEHVMDKVMFENDRGDELLRRTVFGYELKFAAEMIHGV